MIEMATDKETFLVPAPPPPLLKARAGDEAPEEPPAAEDPQRREEPASEQFFTIWRYISKYVATAATENCDRLMNILEK